MHPARWFRDLVASRARSMPVARRLAARLRRRQYTRRISRFLEAQDGRADAMPDGIVFEPTMRCNLQCEFCYVGGLLNVEDEWRRELPVDVLRRLLPARAGLRVNLTGGEIFMRKDIMEIFGLLGEKGYVCGYVTTNGVLIDEERADALAGLAAVGALEHVSVSIDGPREIHDTTRGVKGTFERTAAGLARLAAAAARKRAPLRISINTTVTRESLTTLDRMVEVAIELGVDAIGINHLMFATPSEVSETARLVGTSDLGALSTFVTENPGVTPHEVRSKVEALGSRCAERNVRFDVRPKVLEDLYDPYYTPGASLEGRCLYPFLNARVSYSGKAYFCPFIRVEVGNLETSSLGEIWNGARYVELRRRLLERRLFPICQRCCKVELSPTSPRQSS
jgi:MoaA/NifB/PqqE/SkfB family radical SAM enzyme